MERCVTCHFYDRHNTRISDGKAGNAGQCRRSAPQLHPVNAKAYMIEGVWPTVRDDDWCGEWKALVRRVDPNRLQDLLAPGPTGAKAPVAEVSPRATTVGATPLKAAARAVPPPGTGSAFGFATARGSD